MVALHEELLAEDQLCGLETSLTHDNTTHGQQEGDTPGEGQGGTPSHCRVVE
jgi:hypothetical protein